MKTTNMHCKSISQIQSGAYCKLKVILLVEHTYVGEVLIQVWLQSNKN